jgi:hypothetical protein
VHLLFLPFPAQLLAPGARGVQALGRIQARGRRGAGAGGRSARARRWRRACERLGRRWLAGARRAAAARERERRGDGALGERGAARAARLEQEQLGWRASAGRRRVGGTDERHWRERARAGGAEAEQEGARVARGAGVRAQEALAQAAAASGRAEAGGVCRCWVAGAEVWARGLGACGRCWSRAGAGVGASAAQQRALERRALGDAGNEAARGGTKRWLATRRTQEELRWKASARDAGTR